MTLCCTQLGSFLSFLDAMPGAGRSVRTREPHSEIVFGVYQFNYVSFLVYFLCLFFFSIQEVWVLLHAFYPSIS